MKTQGSVAIAVLTFCVTLSDVGLAQLTQSETLAFPLDPPSQGWADEKTFTYTGDYLYTTTPNPFPTVSYYRRDLDYGDYYYYRFTGTRNRRFDVFIAWGGLPASSSGECQHTHLNYALKGHYTMIYNGETFTDWKELGGGTMSGIWDPTTQTCVHSVDNPQRDIDTNYGWGTDAVSVEGTIRAGSWTYYLDEVRMVVMAPTHGTGQCNDFACLEPVKVYAYTTPL